MLDALLPPLPEAATQGAEAADAVAGAAPSAVGLADEDRAYLSAQLGEAPDVGTRSHRVAWFARKCVENGCTDPEAVEFVKVFRPARAKFGTGDRLADEAARIVGKARGEHGHAGLRCVDAGCARRPDRQRVRSDGTASTSSTTANDSTSTETVEVGAARLAARIIAESRVDWGALWSMDFAAEEWLIEPLIPVARLVSIFAPAKQGKSLVVLEAVACAASGRPVFGMAPTEPVTTLYCDYEMTPADLHERLADMGFGPSDDLSRLHYLSLPSIPPLDTPEGGAFLVALVEATGARLVVIDTTSRVISGKENDADTVTALARNSLFPLKARGVAVARLDHEGKDSERGARGSSAKRDDVDVQWRLKRTDDGVVLDHGGLARISWAPRTVVLRRRPGDDLGHTLTQDAVPAEAKAVAELLDRLGVPPTATKRETLAALKQAGRGKRSDVVLAAMRHRKSRSPEAGNHDSGTTSGTTHGEGGGNDF